MPSITTFAFEGQAGAYRERYTDQITDKDLDVLNDYFRDTAVDNTVDVHCYKHIVRGPQQEAIFYSIHLDVMDFARTMKKPVKAI